MHIPGEPTKGEEPTLGEPATAREAIISQRLDSAEPFGDPEWSLFVDGSSNKQGSGAGLILTGPDGLSIEYVLRFCFKASNNEAEYEALIVGMKLALEVGADDLRAHNDSQLVTNQVLGEYEARESKMSKYLTKVKTLAQMFKRFEVVKVPRTENAKADTLSRLASSGYTNLGAVHIEVLKKASVDAKEETVLHINQEPSWIDDIVEYLRNGTLPEDKKESRKIIQRSARFTLHRGELYKRSYSWPYLKCLGPIDATRSVREVHEGICGEHLGGKALAHKILRKGYYWPTLRKDASELVKKSVVCRFGIPKILITDNGRQFDNAKFKKFCTDLEIEQRFTSVAHPQTNGQTEVTNRILLQGIRKRLDDHEGRWVDELYHVLLAYRTTARTATGETPFNLTSGTETLIPVEIGAPTLRNEHFNEHLNPEGLRTNLDLLEEASERAGIRMAVYQQRVARYQDTKVKERLHRVGDLVLRRTAISQPTKVGKLAPNWEGPYKVARIIRPGTYWLETLDGQTLPHSWNSKNLKRFHQ
ncbi:uncharacterized protein LOC143883127 [Tasmannia lanceolata]|uniref:uncharacterized protein LOC143883127 n=1 Tax=Tasmannia lanceolata TaxID=3420 RepID=UPI0040649710